MTVIDPIADMLTRIRNAVMAGHTLVAMPSSKLKLEIAKIMKDEGYLEGFELVENEESTQKVLRMKIKYVGERRARRSVISGIERIASGTAFAFPTPIEMVPRLSPTTTVTRN